ncbi:MAG: helix-turn-helix transcriptional regulator [Limisphaerales bacterium]|jgi:predicted DNA-binding transcriptional regulator YafY|tara:strand:- start:162 stop:1124 length:963 start_codon:yes stop_codon:yes gene_type:complete
MERMLKIHQAIQSARYPNATGLAGQLEVSTKSIHRDIEFMRDRLDLPIEYDAARYGYYYTQEVGAFPTFHVTEGEMVALLIAEKALQQYRGTTFEKPLVSAFQKIAEALPETISLNLSDWSDSISFRTSALPQMNLEVFDQLAKAVSRKRRVALHYRKPGQKKAQARTVDPYHLSNINGEWFLFGYCHLREDIRTFVPSRVCAVDETGDTFKRPKKFNIEDRLQGSFGVHSGGQTIRVTIHFSHQVADYIREKIWHPTQQLKALPDEGVALTLQLSSLVEIQRWILGWGAHARVLEPESLKNQLKESAEKLVALYGQPSA